MRRACVLKTTQWMREIKDRKHDGRATFSCQRSEHHSEDGCTGPTQPCPNPGKRLCRYRQAVYAVESQALDAWGKRKKAGETRLPNSESEDVST